MDGLRESGPNLSLRLVSILSLSVYPFSDAKIEAPLALNRLVGEGFNITQFY